jgi:hypothetical protein
MGPQRELRALLVVNAKRVRGLAPTTANDDRREPLLIE